MKTIKITPNLARIQFDSMEEWLVNRKGIGGSDASAILGLNPYKTNQELWMEKKGQMSPVDISDKSYVKYGNDADEELRANIIAYYPIAKNTSKKKRQQMLAGLIRPTKKPDLDNVIKSILDALNKVAYHDDTQIVSLSMEKFYSGSPRVEVSISNLENKS